MWLLKGIFLGVGLFLVGAIVYLIMMLQASKAQAIGSTAIEGWTVQNPLFWAGFVATVVIGCAIVRSRSVKA